MDDMTCGVRVPWHAHHAHHQALPSAKVQRVVCGGCGDFKVIISQPAADHKEWGAKGYASMRCCCSYYYDYCYYYSYFCCFDRFFGWCLAGA
jgi:hypothetical protein